MAVFDGMGGESCGEIAAFLASEEFGKFYNANKRMLRDMPEDFIDDVCEKMNQAVCRYGTEHHIWSMGTQWRCSSLHQSLCLPAILGTAGFILWMVVSFSRFPQTMFWWYGSWESPVNPVSWTS